MTRQTISDPGHRCNFGMVPHLLLTWRDPTTDKPLDPYAITLYLHYVHLSGNHHGAHDEPVRQTAKATAISLGQVVAARKRLAETGWIIVRVEGLPGHQITHVTLTDRWDENCVHTVNANDASVHVVNASVHTVNANDAPLRTRARRVKESPVNPVPEEVQPEKIEKDPGGPPDGSPGSTAKNKNAAVIDAIRAACGHDAAVLRPQDHKAIKDTVYTAEIIAEVYCAVFSGTYGDPYMQRRLSVVNVIGWVAGYLAWRAASTNGTHPPTNEPNDRYAYLTKGTVL